MNRKLSLLAGFLTTLPLAVEVPAPHDTTGSRTTLRAAGGYGYYAFMARGCEGQIIDHVPVHALDGAVGIDHEFSKLPVHLGVRGGWTQDKLGHSADPLRLAGVPQGQTFENRYVNPYVTFDPGDAAFSVGYVFHEEEFMTAGEGARESSDHDINDISASLRLGRFDTRYFQVSWMEGMPIYSDGGYFSAGMGGQLAPRRVRAFIGIGAGGPMEGAGPLVRTDVAITKELRVQLMLHGNTSGAATVGLGASYAIPR